MAGAAIAAMLGGPIEPIVANWADISGLGGGTNANVTPTGYTGTRAIKPTFTFLLGITLEYRINSGTYTAIASGSSFNITAGDTVNWRYVGPNLSVTYTVTVTDVSRSDAIIDTFQVTDTTP